MYIVITILGITIILYHVFKIYKKIVDGKNPWVFFLIGPLLIYIGINKDKKRRLFFELVLMLVFASIGYNGYYLHGYNGYYLHYCHCIQ